MKPGVCWPHMRGLRLAAALTVWALGLWPAGATRMIPLAIEELTRLADTVVHGRVVDLESARDAEGRVFTRVGLQPLEYWKGTGPADRCELVAGGGVLGERAVVVEGQARYEVGDEVVAFLARNPAGERVTVGLSQGRFAVRTEAGSGRRFVSNPFWGSERDADAGPARATVSGPDRGAAAPLTLEHLRRRIREASR